MTAQKTGCVRGLELCKGTWWEGALKTWGLKESLLGDTAFKLRPKRWTEFIKLNKWWKMRVLGRNHLYKEILLVLQKLHIQHRCKQWDKRAAAAAAESLQSCPTLRDSTDGSPPGSPVPGILQARTLEWVAISFSNAWKWPSQHTQSFIKNREVKIGFSDILMVVPAPTTL